jgi:hypothetical protein
MTCAVFTDLQAFGVASFFSMEQSMKRLLIHPQTALIIRASVRDAMAPDDVLAAALKNAFEHIDAATKCRATMPDSDTAPEARRGRPRIARPRQGGRPLPRKSAPSGLGAAARW